MYAVLSDAVGDRPLPRWVGLVRAEAIRHKPQHSETERGMLNDELSGREPVADVIELHMPETDDASLAERQLKTLLGNMGFNVHPAVSSAFSSDFSAVLNIKGFIFPFWQHLPDVFPVGLELALLTKYGPGRERLHIRAYSLGRGKWYLTAHTDINWISPDIFRVYASHMKSGAGDYSTGTAVFMSILQEYRRCMRDGKRFSFGNIVGVVKRTVHG